MDETYSGRNYDRNPDYWDKRYLRGIEHLSKPVYRVIKDEDLPMYTRDGVKLMVDIYRPDTPAGETFPGLVAYSSYGKSVQTLDRAPLQFKTVLMDHTIEAGDVEYYVRCGYVVCIPDARGAGKSEGQWDGLYGRQEAEDCYDVIEWLALQDYCTGMIGMIGISYFSILQPFVAALQPPHLKAIMMCEVLDSLYHHNYVGGAFFDRSFLYNHFCPATNQMSWSERHYTEKELRAKVEKRIQDPDVKASALLTRVLSCWPPRHQSYFFDTILHNYEDDFWVERTLTHVVDQIKIPMYLGSEYYDRGRFTQGPFYVFNHCDPALPRKVFCPESHDDLYLPHRTLTLEYLRWYDYWLKGIDTGIMEEPPIKLKVEATGKYRYEYEWPLARTQWKKLYLRSEGRMDFVPGEEEPPDTLTFASPLTQQPLYPREVPSLCWSTQALPEDTEVTGPLTMYLSAALSTPDAQFNLLLNDIDEQGNRQYITSGSLRASHRLTGFEGGKPWAPRHDHSRSVLIPVGEVNEYVLELMTISRLFRKGHRIEIVLKNICNTEFNFITFIPPLETVRYDIYHTGKQQSYLLLPVVPQSPEENWLQQS